MESNCGFSPAGKPGRVYILGVGIDPVTMDEAVAELDHCVESGKPALVVTANPEIIMTAREDKEFATILSQANLVVADGAGVVAAGRILGRPIPQRVPGIELAGALLELAAKRGYKVFFLGAKPGVADEAARVAQDRYPGLIVAGTHHGYFSEDESPSVEAQVRSAKPDIVLAGLGAPKQEKWLSRYLASSGSGVGIGVGGSFDVMAGKVKRAPRIFQALGLEWFYRVATDRKRIRRTGKLFRFAFDVIIARVSGGLGG